MAEWNTYHVDNHEQNENDHDFQNFNKLNVNVADVGNYKNIVQHGKRTDFEKGKENGSENTVNTKVNIDKIKDLHLILPPSDPQMDTSLSANTKVNIDKIKDLHLILPPSDPQMDTSLSAPLPITAPKNKMLIKNEKSEFVATNDAMNDANIVTSAVSSNAHDINTNGNTTTKKAIPSALKLCTSHSNPAYFRSVHVNNNHQHQHTLSPNIEYNISDDHTSPSNQSEVTLITPSMNGNALIYDKTGRENKIEDFDGDLLAYNTW
eukprot:CAMPEP_0201596208 /NCGR_PEP_ID=MMETSP0190_2-20130828/192965_1 /ASSEMBLY_ACC=CAM_ASM_000263 /TAXON_ID=37353 /ORGANISM="Rosalina sp." /LENGTH=263 /DNA_ID=CAMNT_0048056475 /DNA_START=161 /DNA_END=949 /DNA_ORIENTATION=-